MKLSQRAIYDLCNMIDHSRQDISYDAGGTFYLGSDTEEVDKQAVKSVERAILIIKKLILEN